MPKAIFYLLKGDNSCMWGLQDALKSVVLCCDGMCYRSCQDVSGTTYSVKFVVLLMYQVLYGSGSAVVLLTLNTYTPTSLDPGP